MMKSEMLGDIILFGGEEVTKFVNSYSIKHINI